MQLITGSCGGERCINMAVTLREIIKQVQHLEMKLVAGETGLDHEVSWTHMVDSDTISAFLQGQELTFTTGLGLNENLTLLRLVKEVWRNKASGIVINTVLPGTDIKRHCSVPSQLQLRSAALLLLQNI